MPVVHNVKKHRLICQLLIYSRLHQCLRILLSSFFFVLIFKIIFIVLFFNNVGMYSESFRVFLKCSVSFTRDCAPQIALHIHQQSFLSCSCCHCLHCHHLQHCFCCHSVHLLTIFLGVIDHIEPKSTVFIFHIFTPIFTALIIDVTVITFKTFIAHFIVPIIIIPWCPHLHNYFHFPVFNAVFIVELLRPD